MSAHDTQDLIRFAEACRRGLESLADRSGSMFHGFPAAACGPAAELIGRLLKERFGLVGYYVCGSQHPTLSPTQTHAWFEADGHIIDITHDQFGKTGVVGWVLPLSGRWYASFGHMERRQGFCLPQSWPMYPYDGYAAMLAALDG